MDDSGVSCRTLFATDRLFVGELTCRPNSSDWGRINTIGHRVNIAFPRTSGANAVASSSVMTTTPALLIAWTG